MRTAVTIILLISAGVTGYFVLNSSSPAIAIAPADEHTARLVSYFKDVHGRTLSTKDRVVVFVRGAGCGPCKDMLLSTVKSAGRVPGLILVVCPESEPTVTKRDLKCETLVDRTCENEKLPFAEIVTYTVFLSNGSIDSTAPLEADMIPSIVDTK